MLKPSLELFFMAFIVGAGAGLGWAVTTFVFGELVRLARG